MQIYCHFTCAGEKQNRLFSQYFVIANIWTKRYSIFSKFNSYIVPKCIEPNDLRTNWAVRRTLNDYNTKVSCWMRHFNRCGCGCINNPNIAYVSNGMLLATRWWTVSCTVEVQQSGQNYEYVITSNVRSCTNIAILLYFKCSYNEFNRISPHLKI